MKTNVLKLGVILSLALFFTGCKTQNMASGNKMQYKQALQYLDSEHFKIKMIEFFNKKGDHTVQYPSDSYVALCGSEAVLRFSKDLSFSSSSGSSFIEDKSPQLLNNRKNRKGDVLFDLKINGGRNWLNYLLQVTLYKNTNKCFVQVKNMWQEEVATFTGVLEACGDE